MWNVKWFTVIARSEASWQSGPCLSSVVRQTPYVVGPSRIYNYYYFSSPFSLMRNGGNLPAGKAGNQGKIQLALCLFIINTISFPYLNKNFIYVARPFRQVFFQLMVTGAFRLSVRPNRQSIFSVTPRISLQRKQINERTFKKTLPRTMWGRVVGSPKICWFLG